MKSAARVIGILLMVAGLATRLGSNDCLLARFTPLALKPGGPAAFHPGLVRDRGHQEPLVDTVDRPMPAGNGTPVVVGWYGLLKVPRPGRWALGLYTDRPGTVELGPLAIVRHPGAATPVLVARSVELAEGLYPLAVNGGGVNAIARITLVWQPPGGKLAVVPPDALGHGDGPPPGGATVERVVRPPLATRALDWPLAHPLELSAPVLTHWDHRALGVPTFPPLYTIELTGRLAGAPHGKLSIASSGALEGTVGGAAVSQSWAADPRVVDATGAAPFPLSLTAFWGAGEDERLALAPSAGAHLEPPEPAGAALPVAALVAGLALVAAAGRPDARGGRQAAVAALLALALCLRLSDYTVVPRPLETEDELIHHWNGTSLVSGAGSIGWSDWPAYGAHDASWWWGRRLHIVRPFLDWPPEMCLTVGVIARLAGVHDALDIPLHVTRLWPIFLSVMGVWLTYRLARETAGGTAAPLCATALVATLPLAVGSARLVKSEALLTPLALALLLTAIRAGRAATAWRTLAVGVLAAAVVAVKPSGLAFAGAAVLTLVRARQTYAALVATAGALVGLATYPAWGCLWDNTLYAAVQSQMAHASLRLDNFVAFIGSGALVDREFGAGWMILFWAAVAAPGPRGARGVKVAIAAYTTLVALTTWYPFGWYRIPLYPLLAIPAGTFLARVASRPRPGTAFLVVATALVPALAYRLPLEGSGARPLVAALVAAALAVPVADWLRPGALPWWLPRAAGVALVGAVLVLAAAVSLHLPWIDQGLARDRQAAYEPLRPPPGEPPGRMVRWR